MPQIKTISHQTSETPFISLSPFLEAIRHTGYKSTGSAISEIVDNSLDAGSSTIDINIREEESANTYTVQILDNGVGMSPSELTESLRFGGSSRFEIKNKMGRFGMGLPSASLSQCRRIEVYSWKRNSPVYFSYLDLGEIKGGRNSIPEPKIVPLPTFASKFSSGTVVIWLSCDRLDFRRKASLEKHISTELGRRFRKPILSGVDIRLNKKNIKALDPLMISQNAKFIGGHQFGPTKKIEIRTDINNEEQGDPHTGFVNVTFSLLPVLEWHSLDDKIKRDRGISRGAGVTVMRNGREVDFGWFFMGTKRKENYDDWWRCQVDFDASLDEQFGISFSKQSIKPSQSLNAILTPHISAVARNLNQTIRADFKSLSESTSPYTKAQNIHNLVDKYLPKIGAHADRLHDLEIIEQSLSDPILYRPDISEGKFKMILNTEHIFYRNLFPISDNSSLGNYFGLNIQLLLLAASRAEMCLPHKDFETFRFYWGKVLTAYLEEL
jgi:hypothetical protein